MRECARTLFGFFARNSRERLSYLVPTLWILCLTNNPALALDPDLPPGSNFDLSHWHLTLPDDDATTIKPSELVDGYTDDSWFYTGADGAMVFYCPVNGGTTGNSINPRSELRERIDSSTTSVNWTYRGTHVLEAQCRILQAPSSGQLWFGQIHGYLANAPALVLLRYNKGVVETQFRPNSSIPSTNYWAMTNVALGQLISYRIQFADGLLSITVNGATQVIDVIQSDPAWTNQTFYFKAGSYCQDNSGPSSEGARVAFYSLQATHRAAPSPPLISTQPTSVSTNEGATARFRIAAKGTAPLWLQWYKDGVAITEGTNSNLIIPNASTNEAGKYCVILTNQAGSVTSRLASLSLVPPGYGSLLAAALDASNLLWTAASSESWLAQVDVTHDAEDAAQSAPVGHSQTRILQTTVKGPGVIAFWWKVSSEPSSDRLLFSINGTEKARISGECDWQWKSFAVSTDIQVLKWTYSKNSEGTGGFDRGWVDQVQFISDSVPTAPRIAVQPVSRTAGAQTTATFNVGALGSSPLTYQWQFNGTNLNDSSSAGISGATAATLKLANVQIAQAGLYSVIISNAIGSVVSSESQLTVIPLISVADAVDTLALTWSTSGTPPWLGQIAVTHDGIDAARSGTIAHDKSVSMQTTVVGPGTLSFWWKVSCETNNDRLRLYINGSERARISGEVDWQQRVFTLPSGAQTLQWKYSKNSSISLGEDRGWIDQMQFTPNVVQANSKAAELLNSSLLDRSSTVGLSASFSNGLVRLQWPAASGKTFRVFYKDDLADADWIPLPTNILATGGMATFADPADQPQRFYRVIED